MKTEMEIVNTPEYIRLKRNEQINEILVSDVSDVQEINEPVLLDHIVTYILAIVDYSTRDFSDSTIVHESVNNLANAVFLYNRYLLKKEKES